MIFVVMLVYYFNQHIINKQNGNCVFIPQTALADGILAVLIRRLLVWYSCGHKTGAKLPQKYAVIIDVTLKKAL